MSASALNRALALCLLLTGAAPLYAVSVSGLYEGQVAVGGKDTDERAAAMGRALRQVVSKLTGLAQPQGAAVDAAAADAQRFVLQFSYRESRDAQPPLALWVRFEPAAVDALLRDAGLPIWGAQRPDVLAWVAVARGDGLEIVSAEAGDDAVPAALRQRAWERGVPLSLPLLDLEDRMRIQAADRWPPEPARIAEASSRYAPASVLVGRVEPDGAGGWIAHWRLEQDGNSVQWQTRGASAEVAAAGAMDAVADRVSARYAQFAGDSQPLAGGIEVRVSGVRSLSDYARTLDYLQGLDQVSQLSVSAVRGEDVAFRMHVRGGEEGLRRVAAFGGVLAVQPPAQEGGALHFRLLP
jgi:hypothetical protein